jgi:uncharacterized membrane protein YedE/YeeE
MNQDWINALLGGVVIGGAVSLMLLLNGRVTGISGIINGLLSPVKGDTGWRLLFVLGLVLGGFALRVLHPEVFSGQLDTGLESTVVAGLLVGFGTVMGSGCTSGHGVCGISRLSPRSLVATMAFIAAGMMAVVLFKSLGILS